MIKQMLKSLALSYLTMIVVIAGLILAFPQLNLKFWLKPPPQKLAASIANDFQLLTKSKKLPEELNDTKTIAIKTDSAPMHDWLTEASIPVTEKKDGKYRLEVFSSLIVTGVIYSAMMQFDIVEISSNNTIWEANRTYPLGLIY